MYKYNILVYCIICTILGTYILYFFFHSCLLQLKNHWGEIHVEIYLFIKQIYHVRFEKTTLKDNGIKKKIKNCNEIIITFKL